MKTDTTKSFRTTLLAASAVAAIMAAPVAVEQISGGRLDLGGSAQAQTQGQGQGQGQKGQGQGGQGYMGGGSSSAGQGGSVQGQRGPDETSDAKGPKYQGGSTANKPGAGTRGGKPVWAQEGVPEVELGRLSVVRAPAQVIDKALTEALSNFDPVASAALYSMSAEQFAIYLTAHWDTVVMIDSPLENLGLLKDYLANNRTQLPGVTPYSKVDLAAIFLGSASDKTIAITPDTVLAVTTILGLTNLSNTDLAEIAAKADTVRTAISEAHG